MPVKLHEGFCRGSPVRNPPATQEMCVQSVGREDPLEKEMTPPSRVLAQEISWRSLVGYSPWSRRVRRDSVRAHTHTHTHTHHMSHVPGTVLNILQILANAVLPAAPTLEMRKQRLIKLKLRGWSHMVCSEGHIAQSQVFICLTSCKKSDWNCWRVENGQLAIV